MSHKSLIADDMEVQGAFSPEMRVLMNHIYEYKKGVRNMIIFTCRKRYEKFATERLKKQDIEYVVMPAGKENINIYFGRRELSPEEDFILGTLLGYDLCAQCERYCTRKCKCGQGVA